MITSVTRTVDINEIPQFNEISKEVRIIGHPF